MDNSVHVSAIVCCYNDGHLLPYLLDSVLKQVVIEPGFELLLIDNGSSDDTRDVFDRYAGRFAGRNVTFRYYFEKKRGLNHARNKGLQEARYPYVFFTDADAKLSCNYLQYLYRLIALKKPMILCGPYEPWYNTPKPSWYKDEYNSSSGTYGNTEKHLDIHESPSGINMILNRKMLIEAGGFGTQIVYKGLHDRGEETELFARLRKKSRSISMLYSPELLVYHYTRPQMMSMVHIMKQFWGVGATHARIRPRRSLGRSLRDMVWAIRVIVTDSLKHIPFMIVKREQKYQQFLVEVFFPRLYDLSLSLHRIVLNIKSD